MKHLQETKWLNTAKSKITAAVGLKMSQNWAIKSFYCTDDKKILFSLMEKLQFNLYSTSTSQDYILYKYIRL